MACYNYGCVLQMCYWDWGYTADDGKRLKWYRYSFFSNATGNCQRQRTWYKWLITGHMLQEMVRDWGQVKWDSYNCTVVTASWRICTSLFVVPTSPLSKRNKSNPCKQHCRQNGATESPQLEESEGSWLSYSTLNDTGNSAPKILGGILFRIERITGWENTNICLLESK